MKEVPLNKAKMVGNADTTNFIPLKTDAGRAYMECLEFRRMLSTNVLNTSESSAGFLQTTSTMPVAQAGGAGATVGRKAYFLNSHGGVLESYDTATAAWSVVQVPALPDDGSIVGTAVGKRVVFVGSWTVPGLRSPSFPDNNMMLVYDTQTQRAKIVTIPVKSQWYAAFGIGNHVIIEGSDNSVHNSAFDYNFSTGRWRMLKPPGGFGLNEIVVGQSVEFVNSHIDIYNTVSGRWTQREIHSDAPNNFFGSFLSTPVAIGTKHIEYFGGNRLRVLDTITGEWSTPPAVPNEASHGRLVTIGSKVIVAGGNDGLHSIETVSITDAANFEQLAPYTLLFPRTDVASTTVGTQVIFAGGDSTALTPDNPTSAPLTTVNIFTDLMPAAVLSGDMSGNIGSRDNLTIYNTGDADLTGPYGIRLYASLDRTLNGAILVGTRGVTAPLPAGASATFGVRTILPKDTPAGTYHLLAAISDGAGHLTPIAAEDATFRVGGKQVAKPAGIRPAKSMAGAFTRAAHSARQWT